MINLNPSNWATHGLLFMLWLYRKGISPLKPPCCRFCPTCSEYATVALRRFGLVAGCRLILRRLLRCQPFYRGAYYDPVPPTAGRHGAPVR